MHGLHFSDHLREFEADHGLVDEALAEDLALVGPMKALLFGLLALYDGFWDHQDYQDY
jgi:hypothetical protein